jgi:hypothetical protein
MAQRQAPDPDPSADEPTSGTPWPFMGALLVVVLLILAVMGAQLLSPAQDELSVDERINRTVADYVRAHNENDQDILARLRCEELPEAEAPLSDVEGTVELQATQDVAVEGDRATVDVRATVDGESRIETWQVVQVDSVWRVCEF